MGQAKGVIGRGKGEGATCGTSNSVSVREGATEGLPCVALVVGSSNTIREG